MNRILRVALPLALTLATGSASSSTCYGTPGQGRLQGGVPLPVQGQNYVPYSTLGVTLGRTYVHQTVRDIVVEAYGATRLSMPEKHFMYAETGLATGGPFKPHRTHQSGVSVDFMVPVVDRANKSVLIPASIQNKFGYELEFDANGSLDDLKIDFEAMAEHLYQLAEAAKMRQVKIKTVIFQKELTELLFKTKRGKVLRDALPFMKTQPWIKHDEHYHVDFSIPCRPIDEYKFGTK
jgi:penicillin-insensitive murein endopeptidase